jgi:hypothetical protein
MGIKAFRINKGVTIISARQRMYPEVIPQYVKKKNEAQIFVDNERPDFPGFIENNSRTVDT